MDDAVLPRRSASVLVLLLLVGVAAIGVSLLTEQGSEAQATTGAAGAALATLVAAALIAGSIRATAPGRARAASRGASC